uniref:Uncharacterized protein n=1 Tax=Xenopus tropicalis TaxID=8364 RepID=A0A803K8F2_XENTR
FFVLINCIFTVYLHSIEDHSYTFSHQEELSNRQLLETCNLWHWFSTFQMPQPFNTVPYVVVTPNHKIIPKTIGNMCFSIVLGDPCEKVVENHWSMALFSVGLI